ncbi:MAG: Outer membrane protein OprM [Verrucomicrobiae bacterium]|nr:Outer membrane protein OprM [Verrucomicrobiae bacterium]
MKHVAVLTLVILTGCAVGPDYRSPKTELPANWSESHAGGITNRTAQLAQWWKTFQDPELDSLIERALLANHDLRMAASRLREARALRAGRYWDMLPTIEGQAAYINARTSKNAQVFPIDKINTETYDAHFDAVWEIDVFGRKRRGLEAVKANFAATQEDQRDVLVSVLAEVARNYVELRGFQRRSAITRDNIAAQQVALDLTRARFKGGISSQLDVAQAAALLAGTQSQLPVLEAATKQTLHRLAVLIGQTPDKLLAELVPAGPIPGIPPEVPVGLPSELLRRRADIRRAERRLAATTARIGVETAELFPKFSLIGTGGLQSLSTSDWFSGGSRYWTAGPTVTWRLFELGKIRSQIKAATAREEEALAFYEQSVLLALEDVENALVNYAQEQERHRSLHAQVAANRQAVELANELYSKGNSDFLTVLDAKRSLYRAEDDLAQCERTVTTNLIALYKALGGGWEEIKLVEKR